MINNLPRMPKARRENLIIKELPDETLVYDLLTDKAHCLHETAARVWRNCDGTLTISELCEALETETNQPVPADLIWLALDQLEKFNLIENTAWRPPVLQEYEATRTHQTSWYRHYRFAINRFDLG